MTRLLAILSLTLAIPTLTNAQIPPTDNPTGTPTEKESFDEESSTDNEVRARLEAFAGWFPKDLGEPFKLHAIDELALQKKLYANQLPGGVPPAGMSVWRSLGPTTTKYKALPQWKLTDSGRIRTILPHPTNADVVYVLTSGGGLWKTTNFTQPKPTWQPKTDGLLSTSGGSVAFGRSPDTLYLGIGDPLEILGLVTGVMVKSTDGGNSWGPFINLPGAFSVRDVKVDTSGPTDVVLVATDVGLFRSADNGATYVKVAAGPGQVLRNRIVWSLARTSAGWLATAIACGSFFCLPAEISVSTDRGATWSLIPNEQNGFSDAGRTTLAVGAPGDSIVYAFAADTANSEQRDLFKSVDGGLNWAPLNINQKTPAGVDTDCQLRTTTMELMGNQAFWNQMILVDPTDSSRNTIYLGGQFNSAKTTDGGNTWKLMTDWMGPHLEDCTTLPYMHADHHAAAFSTLGGKKTIFLGTDGGLFVSTDGGASVSDEKNEGIVTVLASQIVSSVKHPETLVIGTQDLGSRVRQGDTLAYNEVVTGDGEGVGWSQANDAVALTSFVFSTIFRIEDPNPSTHYDVSRADRGIGGLDFYSFGTPIATPTAVADPTGLQFFHHTGWRVYKTDDGALSWHVIGEAGFNGLRPKTVNGFFSPIFRITFASNSLAISPLDTNHIAVAGNGGFLAITTDGGATWTERQLIALVPGYGGFNKSPAWANNNILYLASENPNPNAIRFVRSTDGGVTWSAGGSGLPDLPIRKIVVDPADETGGTVYAATWIGVYRTTDGGAHWSLFGAGLPRVDTPDLYIAPDGSFLRAATYGRGVWEIQLRAKK